MKLMIKDTKSLWDGFPDNGVARWRTISSTRDLNGFLIEIGSSLDIFGLEFSDWGINKAGSDLSIEGDWFLAKDLRISYI